MPELAWDQIMLMFDRQDESGILPDSVNDTRRPRFNYTKPPIYGWAFGRMMGASDHFGDDRLAEIYRPLSRQTEFWFAYRDPDEEGLPCYNHGNDSGWDNSTVFGEGCPVRAPDLAAYLVIQMEFLAEVASRLGRPREPAAWKRRSGELLRKMTERLWTGERFVTRRAFSGEVAPGDSLIDFVPILLGDRLDADCRAKLVAALSEPGRFVTEHGLATESPRSPLYEPDGYWRGPIWAPSTMIVVDGLARSGERGLAREIALRFCRMCARSGFAENFDALTGEGLRDRAYTWTSSVFLMLANEFLRS
jgi:glycogen debranching enzyme